MTARTLNRSGFKVLVAGDALEMERVRAFWHFFIPLGRIMTLPAWLRYVRFTIQELMMAVFTGEAVACCVGVNLMIKQHVACCNRIHQAQRLLRRL